MFKALTAFIREQFKTNEPIPLHAPVFRGRERDYVLDTIDSTFVSSVGAYVEKFERDVALYTQSPCAVATVNGTSALHSALQLAGVVDNDYIITQALTFVATCNAIRYCRADPIFLDVDHHTLGLSPDAMAHWLLEHAFIDDQALCRYRVDHRIIRACVPMHTFGHPIDLDRMLDVCNQWHIQLIEDAAESLGSLYKGRHTGTLGAMGVLSFNGNKIITTGGGGMILTNKTTGREAKHLTTTAKIAHPFEFYHDKLGFNYRMPNLNAALGCAQLEQLDYFVEKKRWLAAQYHEFFKTTSLQCVIEPKDCRSNYWLNAVICTDRQQRDELLQQTNDSAIMTRTVWQLMNQLPMFEGAITDHLTTTMWLADRVVSLPSGVI